MLHFDHAQIALGLLVVKGDGKIEQEAQHRPFALGEAIQQIACRTLFGSPWGALGLCRLAGGRRRGIGLVAFGQDGVIATKQVCQQQRFHRAGPGLLEFFFDAGQFAQMMHVAQRVGETVALLAQEAIMDTGTMKCWCNTNSIQGGTPSSGMSSRVGEAIRRADMDPPPGCADTHCGFILMDHVRLHQSGLEVRVHLSQLLMTGLHKGGNAACRELNP